MKLKINNEYNKLKKILLAPVDEIYLEQHNKLMAILSKYNVEIFMAERNDSAKYQMFIRDPFIVIDDCIIICNMSEKIRQAEKDMCNDVLNMINCNKRIYLSDEVFVEGGDVIIHNNYIFVGQNGNRTDESGLNFIKRKFGNRYRVIPLFMVNPSEYIPFVHLDCLFNPISDDTVLIYKDGFTKESFEVVKKIFKNLIYVNDKEQNELATNVISLGNKIVIVQKRHSRIIELLNSKGFETEVIDIYDTINETGYTRCLTCPLERL